jgi:hypothetical protein
MIFRSLLIERKFEDRRHTRLIQESWCNPSVHPDFVAPFSPPCKGGSGGGGPGTMNHKAFPIVCFALAVKELVHGLAP